MDAEVCFESTVNHFRRWLKEPLLHFVVLGAAVVALHRWVAPPLLGRQIILSQSVIHGLRQDYLRRNGALPTAGEEAALIQRYIDNEVLYREALALGLDRGDIIVRRRLVQKMEFLTEGVEPLPEPADAELQAYLDAHAEHYAVDDLVTLVHVFAGTDRHGAAATSMASQWREQLLAGADPSALGDPFLRGREFTAVSEPELAGIFGGAFAAAVMRLPVGLWSAPIASSYGVHVVRVGAHVVGHQPPLAEVREAVRRDWRDERRAAADRAALVRLRQRYDIRIEGQAGTAQASELPPPARGGDGAR
jgi:peptidyl-prolyl cis-trans isomerase C